MKLRSSTPYLIAIGYAAVYGLFVRWFAHAREPGSQDAGLGMVRVVAFSVMTVSFLVIVPVCMGFVAVRGVRQPSVVWAIFSGWPACMCSIVVTWLVGWEGSICIVMASPLMFLCSTGGGLVAWTMRDARSTVLTCSVLALPFVASPIEKALGVPTSLRSVRNEIAIGATPGEVWSRIVSVPPIMEDELQPSLAMRLGFPRPIAATLDREGIGGVRRATFEGGVLFLETIDTWEVERRLSFSIAAQTATIPTKTLDEHVTIGGPYFDVLEGTYVIEPRADGVVLHLESRVRVSTPFNLYAGPWADAIMGSIQEQILHVLKQRCEGVKQ